MISSKASVRLEVKKIANGVPPRLLYECHQGVQVMPQEQAQADSLGLKKRVPPEDAT